MSKQESQHEIEERAPKGGAKGPRKQKPFGIRYAYERWWHSGEKWYTTKRGRDQAFDRMQRVDQNRQLPSGKKYRLYKSLEKIEQ